MREIHVGIYVGTHTKSHKKNQKRTIRNLNPEKMTQNSVETTAVTPQSSMIMHCKENNYSN